MTEFLPISSSGHLILTSWLFNWPEPGLTFDLAVHTGTLIALIIFFGKEWIDIIVGSINGRSIVIGSTVIAARKMLLLVLASNIPLVLMLVILQDHLDGLFRTPLMVGYSLIVTAIVILSSEKFGASRKKFDGITPIIALWVMLAQSFAVIPGISRSGMSMSAAVANGVNRETAARYSFLLAGPALSGAGLLAAFRVIKNPTVSDIPPLVLGATIALIAAIASFKWLMRHLRTHSFAPFGYYCFTVGSVIVLAITTSGA